MIWAVVDDAGYQSEYEIVAWGTGWEFPDELNHCKYMGTAQDGIGYVWHYFMREKSKSRSSAEAGVAVGGLDTDYWDSLLTTIPATIQDYAVSTLGTKTYSDYTTSMDNLQNVVEYLAEAVANSNTATLGTRA